MHPVDAEGDISVELTDAPDQTFRGDDGRARSYALFGTRCQLEEAFGGTTGNPDDFGGNKGRGETFAQPQELPESAILRFNRGVAYEIRGEAVALSAQAGRIVEQGVPLDGALLQSKDRP